MASPVDIASTLEANKWAIEQLINDFERGDYFVPFVGAGVSFDYGYPTWSGFLRELAQSCGCLDEVNALMSEGKYEDAAELVLDRLGEQAFDDRYRQAFCCEPRTPTEGTAARHVARLTSGLIVTTNYESVIPSEIKAKLSNVTVLEGVQLDRVSAAIHGLNPTVWKMHGSADERSTRILTRREYESNYEHTVGDSDPAIVRLLNSLFAARRLLFVGCSLAPDRTMEILASWAKSHEGHHYAILEAPEEGERDARALFLSVRNIRPIWYPSGQHSQVPLILDHIACLVEKHVDRLRVFGGRKLSVLSLKATHEVLSFDENEHLDLTEHFNGRMLADHSSWDRVLESIRRHIYSATADPKPIRMRLVSHLSICFAAGSCLPRKRGIAVSIEQASHSGTEQWSTNDSGSGDEWLAEVCDLGDGPDWALSVEAVAGMAHDVQSFVGELLPEVGKILRIYPPDCSTTPKVMGGAHARHITEVAVKAIRDQRVGATHTNTVHVFLGGPGALAFMLGQECFSFGQCQLYEFNRDIPRYLPSMKITESR